MSDNEFLQGVDDPHPFDELAVALATSAARYVAILSPTLDHLAFDNEELASALSALARGSRQTQVRILVANSSALVSRGHRLLNLARRIPSSVLIRRLDDHPDWNGQTLVIRDRDGVLYKPGGSGNDGFYEPSSRAAVRQHLELFDELWSGRVVSDNVLSNEIKQARAVLGDDGERQDFIKTVRGRGYQFVGDVQEIDPEAGSATTPPQDADASQAPANTSSTWQKPILALVALLCAVLLTIFWLGLACLSRIPVGVHGLVW